MIHRFPFLWSHMFDRSDREGSEWASALAENGQANDVFHFDEQEHIDEQKRVFLLSSEPRLCRYQ